MPLFMRRPVSQQIVEAEQVGPGAQTHPQGSRPARSGDWVVTDHSTGQTTTLTAEEFQRDYQPLNIPAHLQAPQPGQEQQPPPGQEQAEQQPPEEQEAFPQRTPSEQGGGMQSPATQSMSDQLPGRPSTAPEQRPRLAGSHPVTTPTGLPEQPGDADKAFHEQQAERGVEDAEFHQREAGEPFQQRQPVGDEELAAAGEAHLPEGERHTPEGEGHTPV